MASRQVTLEYLATTKIGEKGQLTVPKQFRKDLGLGTGALRRIAFVRKDAQIGAAPAEEQGRLPSKLCSHWCWPYAGINSGHVA